MKKFTKFFAFMVALVATLNFSANAQEYFTDYGNCGQKDRYLTSLTFQVNGSDYLALELNQNELEPMPVYFDKTANIIEVGQGGTLRIVPNWNGSWMGVAVLVDYDDNKEFDRTADGQEYVAINNGARTGVQPVEFTVPADKPLGEYRLRYMIDWVDGENLPHANAANDPTGNIIANNRGAVVDVVLKVVAPPAVTAPTFNTNEDGFVLLGDDRFTINSEEGTTIKYTTDDSDPLTSETAVTTTTNSATLTIVSGMTVIKAVTVKGADVSDVATFDKIVTEAELGKEYYIVFQRDNGGALMAGDPMTLGEYNDVGLESQVFVFGKAPTDGLYTLTTKSGQKVQYLDPDGEEGQEHVARFRNNETTIAEELRIVQFGSGDNYEIERKDNTERGMNPAGGFAIGKQIGEWWNGDLSNEVNFVEVPELGNITLNVAIDEGSTEFGTVEIVGESGTSVTKKAPIKIRANPKPGHVFVKWNDGTNDYTTLSYTYTGTEDVTFTATFAKFETGEGGVLTPANVDELKNKYFYIQSGANGLAADWNAGDTRNNVLYAAVALDEDNNVVNVAKLKHAPLSTIENNDYAIWFIEGGRLKNKGSKLYMTASHSQDATGENFAIEAVGNNNQYEIKTGGNSYTCAWQNNTADRLSTQGENSATAWYFVYDSEINLQWIGNSYITIAGKDNGGTWYKGSATAGEHENFNEKDLGNQEKEIVLGGEIQAYHPVTDGISMGYKVLDGADPATANVVVEESYVALPKIGDQDNNSKHYAETSIDISGDELVVGNKYYLHVWFKGEEGAVLQWDSNMSNDYVATFTKKTTGVDDILLENGISVNNGIITVKGVDNFEVFSLAGQQVNAKQKLQAGIYIVKVKGAARKVIVK